MSNKGSLKKKLLYYQAAFFSRVKFRVNKRIAFYMKLYSESQEYYVEVK